MDLKEYISIIKKQIQTFLFVVFLIMVAGLTYFYAQPISYDASLALNITRQGSQQTSEYKYDHYYRLQADEKFADTVVEWLKNPKTAEQIYLNSGVSSNQFSLKKLARIFKPEKRSSQLVLVYFSSPSKEISEKISASIKQEISKNIESLNVSQKEENWFAIADQDPVIIKHSFNFLVIFIALMLAGTFLAFWIVLTVHYFKN